MPKNCNTKYLSPLPTGQTHWICTKMGWIGWTGWATGCWTGCTGWICGIDWKDCIGLYLLN